MPSDRTAAAITRLAGRFFAPSQEPTPSKDTPRPTRGRSRACASGTGAATGLQIPVPSRPTPRPTRERSRTCVPGTGATTRLHIPAISRPTARHNERSACEHKAKRFKPVGGHGVVYWPRPRLAPQGMLMNLANSKVERHRSSHAGFAVEQKIAPSDPKEFPDFEKHI